MNKELIELGQRIRAERIAMGLKQQELADLAAISNYTLSSLERGNPSTTETLSRVLNALGHKGALVNLIEEPPVSPIALQKLRGKQPQRVR